MVTLSLKPINFQPHQIICLEQGTRHLYAEVIDIVEWRQICWLRPFVLAEIAMEDESVIELYDLRQGPDLLLPTKFLRLVFDTEVIPLLSQLQDLPSHQTNHTDAHQQLANFIADICASKDLTL